MKVFLILIALIIAITLYNQKYLGKLAPGIIVLSLLFITFRGHIEKLWENNIESFSGKDLQLSKIEDNIVYSNFENYTFNDTNKELSDSSDLKLTDKFTVMAWVKQKEKTNDWVRIIGKGNKTNRNYGLWVKGKDGQLLSQVYTSKYSNVRVANSYLENDKWTHLAMTYNKDGRQRLYKNGKMIEANDSKGRPLTDDEPLTIGGAEFYSKFKGEITGAVVLNTVLSKQEVKHFAESPDKNLDEILGKNLTNNNKIVKYGETIDLQLIDGQTKEPMPLLKILYAGNKTPAPTELNGNDIVKITDAKDENKVLVMLKSRHLTMIDTTAEPKPEYDTDLFLLKPEVGQLNEKEYSEKISKNSINYGDKIAIAIVTTRQRNILYNQCGWFGCRVLKPSNGYFSHGGKNRDTVPYTTIKNVPMAAEKEVLDTIPNGTGTLPVNEMVSDPKPTGTGKIHVSENINQFTQPPTLTKGLDTENVTPSPIYFAPGTVKYGGLGYKPSYEDINYMNNKFITKPEVVSGFNKRGFCDLENNIMENIDEKCEKLPKDVCASTSCCVLLGDQRCVQGNNQGPTNKGIYNDTTIKNKDVYYYRGKCFGNCSDVPNTNSLPQEMPEMDAVNPSPESEM
jgi:hypothetical protein